MDLSRVLAEPIDGTVKGMPLTLKPTPLREIGTLGLSVLAEDLPLPLMVLKWDAVQHNIELMRELCDRHGALIAPHGKTTMAPQLFAEHFKAGAWGITVATAQQAAVVRSFGVERIVIANEVVGRPELDYLCRELALSESTDIYCWVDSPDGVRALAESVRRHRLQRPFPVLIEMGWPGGRTGARSDKDADEVVAAVRATNGRVQLVGLAVFEGLLQIARQAAGVSGAAQGGDVGSFLEGVREYARALADQGDLPADYLLSGGGSSTFDEVLRVFGAAERPARVLLRSGCYVTHDHGMYAQLSPLRSELRPALELWASVISTPEDNLAFLGFGRRDAPFDAGLPAPLVRYPAGSTEPVPMTGEVVGLNDQHCYLRHSEGGLRVGDRVTLGISHPCTAFDKWRVLPVVDNSYAVIDAIRTYF